VKRFLLQQLYHIHGENGAKHETILVIIEQISTEGLQHADAYHIDYTSRIDSAFYRVFRTMLFATYHNAIEHKKQNKHSKAFQAE